MTILGENIMVNLPVELPSAYEVHGTFLTHMQHFSHFVSQAHDFLRKRLPSPLVLPLFRR
ncbi:hypothetical protein [uncultured Mailhella sp.]|uniref:hypothetical protein n=1 Tax=uncultured Mailhella sp. TaxID=1981031 RepID=UPI0025CF9A36|nr:hypothetical protein [uncultured Mailhella sp.]